MFPDWPDWGIPADGYTPIRGCTMTTEQALLYIGGPMVLGLTAAVSALYAAQLENLKALRVENAELKKDRQARDAEALAVSEKLRAEQKKEAAEQAEVINHLGKLAIVLERAQEGRYRR